MTKLYDLILRAAGFEYRWRGLHDARAAGRGKEPVSVPRWKSYCPEHGDFVHMASLPPEVLERFERARGLVVLEVPRGSMPALERGCPRCQAAKRMLASAEEALA